jgi:hypothetical protein
MANVQTRQVMMMTDEHVEEIRQAIQRSHCPLEVTNESGRKATFRIIRGKLWAYETVGGEVIKNEVMKQSDMADMMKNADAADPKEMAKDEIRAQLRLEHPDMPEQSIEVNADIIFEARQTVLKLAHQGVPPHIASQMVTQALKLTEEDKTALEVMVAGYQADNNIAPEGSEGRISLVKDVVDPMNGMY